MKKTAVLSIFCLLLSGCSWFGSESDPSSPVVLPRESIVPSVAQDVPLSSPSPSLSPLPSSLPSLPPSVASSPTRVAEVPYIAEDVATGLDTPWSVVFTSPDRMLFTERPGRLRAVESGKLIEHPLRTFAVPETGEEGLMSLTVDPDYADSKHVYACLAYGKGGSIAVRVIRFRDEGVSISDERMIIENIPAAKYHAGCRIAFGPDGKLYITTGDATTREIAQDKSSLGGKILRINKDGSIPDDNPVAGSAVWSMGHRNPQGIAWHPVTQELYSTEHGPSGFDGPGGGDEVNRIVKGGNYGWPTVSHDRMRDGMVSPLLVFTPAEAPASAAFYAGDEISQFRNNFFFGALKGEGLWRVMFSPSEPDEVLYKEKLFGGKYGRIRDVVSGPDGALYFTTSNRDGRGTVRTGDDRIMRVRAK